MRSGFKARMTLISEVLKSALTDGSPATKEARLAWEGRGQIDKLTRVKPRNKPRGG